MNLKNIINKYKENLIHMFVCFQEFETRIVNQKKKFVQVLKKR